MKRSKKKVCSTCKKPSPTTFLVFTFLFTDAETPKRVEDESDDGDAKMIGGKHFAFCILMIHLYCFCLPSVIVACVVGVILCFLLIWCVVNENCAWKEYNENCRICVCSEIFPKLLNVC